MTTIHYAINAPTAQPRPDTIEGRRRCNETIDRAISTAVQICTSVGETAETDLIVTSDRYLVDLHLTGDCRGCEPVTFGWTRDFERPHDWVMRGFCKTSTAKDPLKAHLLVAHVIEAWHCEGLVDWVEDEAGYQPGLGLESLLGISDAPHPSPEVQKWVATLSRVLSQIEKNG